MVWNKDHNRTEPRYRLMFALLALAFMAVVSVTMIGIAEDSDAGSTFTVDGISYEITSDNDVSVIDDINARYWGKIEIPLSVDYSGKTYSVTSISDFAFCERILLTSVTIPDSVTSIGDFAFCECTSLISVTIGNSVTSISDYAFEGCTSLISVAIGNSVTSIGDCAFDGCTSLISVTIPDSVTSIGSSAFDGCISLASVIIGNGVMFIGDYAFDGCTSLTSVTIGNGVIFIGDYAFDECVFFDFDGKTLIWDYYDLPGYRYLGNSSLRLIRHDLQNVSFDENGGSVVVEGMIVDEGAEFILPEYTGKRTGHDFGGWSYGKNVYPAGQTIVKVSRDMTFTAVWDPIQYSAVFMNGDEVYTSRTYDYGSAIIAPEGIPEKASTDQYTYEFSYWSGFTEGMIITGDISFYAVYTETLREYDVTFVSGGKEFDSKTLEYGAVITKPAQCPVREQTAQYSYAFKGWNGFTEGMTVTGDITFNAVFEGVLKKIDVTDDKVVVNAEELEYVKAPAGLISNIKAAGNNGKSFELSLSKGKISLDSASAAGLPSGEKEFSFTDTDRSKIPSDIRERIGDRPVYSIGIGDVHEFKGVLTITVEYELRDGEDAEDVCVWYLGGDGTYERISCTYDDGYATFNTTHLSDYAVMVEKYKSGSSDNVSITICLVLIVAIAVFLIIRRNS